MNREVDDDDDGGLAELKAELKALQAKIAAGIIAASCDRSGEAGETSTQIEGSTEGESAVAVEDGQTPKVHP